MVKSLILKRIEKLERENKKMKKQLNESKPMTDWLEDKTPATSWQTIFGGNKCGYRKWGCTLASCNCH